MCSNVTYSLFSSQTSAKLIHYPEDPYQDTGMGRRVVQVTFLAWMDSYSLV